MEQIKEFLFAETMSMCTYFVSVFMLATVASILIIMSGRKYRKSQREVLKLNAELVEKQKIVNAYREQLPEIVERSIKARKSVEEFEQEHSVLKEQNSFYEAKIKHLTEQLKERTCTNRGIALAMASDQGLDSEATVKAAKLYHRFLQGKE